MAAQATVVNQRGNPAATGVLAAAQAVRLATVRLAVQGQRAATTAVRAAIMVARDRAVVAAGLALLAQMEILQPMPAQAARA